ncbi:MAG: hypothetical protein AB8G96_05865 [Phycisphaerales bacterium]
MRQSKYLNGILTVNALLLGGLLWSQIGDQPWLAQPASADSAQRGSSVPRFPNASEQRADLVKAMKSVEKAVQENNKLLRTTLKVEVTNLDSIKIELPPDRSGNGG